jgi:hypothetical protein
MKVIASVMLLAIAPRLSLAQSEMPDTSKFQPEVVIIALDSFNFYNRHAVIVRRSDKLPHDVIVIERKFLSPQIVYSALHHIDILRGLEGTKVNVPTTGDFPVPDYVNGRKFDMDFAALIAEGLQMRGVDSVDVPGIGRAPIMRTRAAYKMTVTPIIPDSATRKP